MAAMVNRCPSLRGDCNPVAIQRQWTFLALILRILVSPGCASQEETKTVAQATASLYGVKTYAEQLAFKEQTLMDDLFLRLPALIRRVLSQANMSKISMGLRGP